MASHERDAPDRVDTSCLSTPSNTSKYSVATKLGSTLPLPSSRRVASAQGSTPSTSTRRTPSAHGPLGSYRSLSRTRGTPLRGGEGLLGKRSFSSTDENGFSTPQPMSSKRSFVSSALATAPRTAESGIGDEEDAYQTPLRRQRTKSAGHSGRATTSSAIDSHQSYELSMLRSEYERRVQSEQQAYQALETQLRLQSRELEALKQQRVEVLHEWESERATHKEKQQEWEKTRALLEEQVTLLRAETLQLHAQHDVIESQRSATAFDSHSEMHALKSQLVHYQTEFELAQSQNVSLSAINKQLEERVSELEAHSSSFSSRQHKSDDEDVALFKDQLSQQIAAVQRLEAANLRLKSENTRLVNASSRMDVLRESNRGLESKLERMQSLQDKLLEKDTEIADMREEQRQWITVLEHGVQADEHAAFVAAANASDNAHSQQLQVPTTLSPDTLPSYISTLRGTIMGLHARIDGLGHTVEQMRTSNIDLSRRAAQGSETEITLRKELSLTSDQLLRAQKQLEIQHDDLRRCKDILASFEQEALEGNTTYESTHKMRITQLEEHVMSLQKECNALKQNLVENAKAAAPDSPVFTKELNHQASQEWQHSVEELKAQCCELTKQVQELGAENDTLWARVGRGEYNTERERCLVLTDNPVSRDLAIRTSTLEALKKENEGLLEQVELLHKQLASVGVSTASSSGVDDAVVPLQTVENLRAELAKLQESLQLKEKGMLRLKQVFTAKANEFREAVQSLFGYKLRFMENGKVKLTSAYAGGARGTTLVFRSDEGNIGEMKLQGEANDGLANVAHLRDYWLSDGIRHSVPCFLAALNLELYENTTQAIRGSFGADV